MRDWFYLVAWLRYKTYGYRRHRQMVQRWWANASMAEVRRGREVRLRREGKLPPVLQLPTGTRATRPPPVNERPQEQGPRQRRNAPPTNVGDILAELMAHD